ncbi:cellulase family glycosylhydrolase [Microbacterium sp. ASV49]|uniref:mannan endo-1,4-beta-mannosidase n=2 Tax=Microbacterium candidum TaxID=3041922 RepID=A0ABT7MW78_9MICO|nr:cellulase family glycosylhydrolase [Microbacterium sp. ASV49]
MKSRRLAALATAIAVAAVGLVAVSAPAQAAQSPRPAPAASFVKAQGSHLTLDGKPYEFAGTNNYYLGYKSSTMVDNVLDDAKAAGLNTIRTWGFQDFQNPDGTNSVQGSFEGVWYQAWDSAAGKPVVNGSADGLQKLDFAIAEAGKRGIRLVIPFTNNWNNFGGMDQYVQWGQTAGLGTSTHADFYTNATIKTWFKTWISTLLNRTNSITGVKYKDDPTIMAWELANEPRCTSAGKYPNGTCNTSTITGWADEMSTYVKSIDRNHLLSAGDEGFFDLPQSQWTLDAQYGQSGYGPGFGQDGADGIDTVALASLKNIDLMSMHLYPDSWKTTAAWGDGWIAAHAAAARKIGKPVYLGEYGIADKATRMPVYFNWLKTIRQTGVDGSLYWMLASRQDDGTLYSDYDGYTVYCPSPVCTLMSDQSKLVSGGLAAAKTLLDVIADNDAATVERDTSADVDLLANDVSFTLPVQASTLDLDPSAPGRQTSTTAPGGSLAITTGGTVRFTPTAGFTGKAVFSYSVGNAVRTASANLTVTVRPRPGDPVLLASWEDGLAGWAPANWQSDPGTLSVGATGATNGSQALQIASNGAWFDSPADSPTLDLTTRASIQFDLTTQAAGTSFSVAVRSGSGWTWCQTPWTWVPAGTDRQHETVAIDSFGCDTSTLTDVHDVLIYLNAGSFAIDNLTIN